MKRPCKELKRIARENLSGQYRISMGAILTLGIIPLVAELPFSMLQSAQQPIGQTIIFYVADFLISLIAFLLSVGVTCMNMNIARGKKPALGMVFYAFKNHPDRFLLAGILLTVLTVLAAIPAGIGMVLFYCVRDPCGACDWTGCALPAWDFSDCICTVAICAHGIYYAGSSADERDGSASHEPQADRRQQRTPAVSVFQLYWIARTVHSEYWNRLSVGTSVPVSDDCQFLS